MDQPIRYDIEQLEQGLRITDRGTEQKDGSGQIDSTAEDREGATVVIELKARPASREAIEEIARLHCALVDKTSKPVRGILVAGDFNLWLIIIKKNRFKFVFTFKMFGCVEADRVSLRATDYGVLLRLVSVSKKGPLNGAARRSKLAAETAPLTGGNPATILW